MKSILKDILPSKDDTDEIIYEKYNKLIDVIYNIFKADSMINHNLNYFIYDDVELAELAQNGENLDEIDENEIHYKLYEKLSEASVDWLNYFIKVLLPYFIDMSSLDISNSNNLANLINIIYDESGNITPIDIVIDLYKDKFNSNIKLNELYEKYLTK